MGGRRGGEGKGGEGVVECEGGRERRERREEGEEEVMKEDC